MNTKKMNQLVAVRITTGHNELYEFGSKKEAEEFINSLPEGTEYARAEIKTI